MPFGLCCVASALKSAGKEVKILDLNFEKNIKKSIDEAVQNFNPGIIGVSVRNIDNGVGFNTLFLLENIKNNIINPLKKYNIPIVLGGGAVGINPEEILEYFGLNYAIKGDGEGAFMEMARRFKNNISLTGCPGLVERKGGKIIQNNPIFCVQDLDALPFTKVYQWIDLKPYVKFNTALPIQTKRGCALNCSYCTYNNIEGKFFRLRSPKKVADEIEEIVKDTGINKIHFTDSVLNIPLEHCKQVLKEIIKKNLKLEFETLGLNPKTVDKELVELMKTAGFTSIDCGAEGAAAITLKCLNKNYNIEELKKAAFLLRKEKIPIQWYFLLGCEEETENTIKETFDFIDSHVYKWDLANIGIGIRIYKGSPLAKNLKDKNNNLFKPFSLPPKSISMEKLKYLIKKESLKRSNVFMYDEDETTPEFLLKLGTMVLNFLNSKQPIWRMWIIKRRVESLLGINKLKLLHHKSKGYNVIK